MLIRLCRRRSMKPCEEVIHYFLRPNKCINLCACILTLCEPFKAKEVFALSFLSYNSGLLC